MNIADVLALIPFGLMAYHYIQGWDSFRHYGLMFNAGVACLITSIVPLEIHLHQEHLVQTPKWELMMLPFTGWVLVHIGAWHHFSPRTDAKNIIAAGGFAICVLISVAGRILVPEGQKPLFLVGVAIFLSIAIAISYFLHKRNIIP